MKALSLSPSALSLGVAVALLTGCGVLRQAQYDMQLPIVAPGAMRQAPALAARTDGAHYKVLYNFGALPDGSNPQASLIDVRGTLYGTTGVGGSSSSCRRGCGTVFSITTGGTENVLYSFGPLPDGEYPQAGLLNAGGTLYGTTSEGGSYDNCGYSSDYFACGTVFSVTLAGSEKVVHSFGNGTDGREPAAGLIDLKGTFYGTTSGGGAIDCGMSINLTCGTVFSTTPSGTENVVFRFTGGRTGSGWSPKAGLIDARGTLYGTTPRGGYHLAGVVFSVTTGGTEKVLHNFGKKPVDGIYSYAGLIDVKGTFYGTTSRGGESSCGSCGTVFSITPDGTEKVLHNFGDGPDGSYPDASLTEMNGTLYGTTSMGGAHGEGTIFSMTLSGNEKMLYSFGSSNSDGLHPYASLIDVNGTLYGTTSGGGAYGNGTVFALTP
jgi:uncharacterized repeat protein (TIGR03803 family)